MRRRNGVDKRCEQSGRRRDGAVGRTIQEENKALAQEVFDTLFNSRDYAAAESGTVLERRLKLPL